MSEQKSTAVPETRGIGTDIAVGVLSGVVGGVASGAAGAVTQQLVDKIKPPKK
jgi:hypothetical protein